MLSGVTDIALGGGGSETHADAGATARRNTACRTQ